MMLGIKSQSSIAEGLNVSATEPLAGLWMTCNNAETIVSQKHSGYEAQDPEFDNSIFTNPGRSQIYFKKETIPFADAFDLKELYVTIVTPIVSVCQELQMMRGTVENSNNGC